MKKNIFIFGIALFLDFIFYHYDLWLGDGMTINEMYYQITGMLLYVLLSNYYDKNFSFKLKE